jgi:hypothetical protein
VAPATPCRLESSINSLTRGMFHQSTVETRSLGRRPRLLPRPRLTPSPGVSKLTDGVAFWYSYGVPETQYAVKVGDFQWVRIPPGQSVARPEATKAAQGGNDMR